MVKCFGIVGPEGLLLKKHINAIAAGELLVGWVNLIPRSEVIGFRESY